MKQFEAGHRAEASVLYKVVHAKNHVQGHYVIVVKGDTFPDCMECTNQVRFEIAIDAVHVYAHKQFKRTDYHC